VVTRAARAARPGAVYVQYDEYGSAIDVTSTDGHICVSGHTSQIVAEDYADYWGADLNIQLNNPGTNVADPYNAIPASAAKASLTPPAAASATCGSTALRSDCLCDSACIGRADCCSDYHLHCF
jgi:hypothetical protein